MMEADSTTADQDVEPSAVYNSVKEGDLVHELSRRYEYFKNIVLPLLQSGKDAELLEWMKENGLIPRSVSCDKDQSGCAMKWTASRVVDKYQWQCSNCGGKIHIRENSFFKNIFCSLSTVFKLILAWLEDMDCENAANIFKLKSKIVGSIYDKIERVVFKRPLYQLGGPGNVLLVELYPDFIDELYPVSSKDSTPKTQHKILCFADTREVPIRYWLHVISGHHFIQTENNNTTLKKWNICEEANTVMQNLVVSGGYCAIGGGAHLKDLRQSIKSGDMFEGVIPMGDLNAKANNDIKLFLMKKIWGPVVKLCEAAQELPKNKMQSYLSCSLWRWEERSTDPFLSLINLITEQDHSVVSRPHSKKDKETDMSA